MATTSRPRARKGDGAQLRTTILDAAESLMGPGGGGSVTVRAVAERCGVTPPAIYLHFPDKRTLLAEVASRHFEQARVSENDPDALEELRRRGSAYVGFALAHPTSWRVLTEHQPMHLVKLLRPTVDRAVAAGVLEVDPAVATFTFAAGIHGSTALLIASPGQGPAYRQQMVDHMLDVLIEGVLST